MIGYPTWMLIVLIAITAALFDPNVFAVYPDATTNNLEVDGKTSANEVDGNDAPEGPPPLNPTMHAAPDTQPTPSVQIGSSDVLPSIADRDSDCCEDEDRGKVKNWFKKKGMFKNWPNKLSSFFGKKSNPESVINHCKMTAAVQSGNEISGYLEPENNNCEVTVVDKFKATRIDRDIGVLFLKCDPKKDQKDWTVRVKLFNLDDREVEEKFFQLANLEKPKVLCYINRPSSAGSLLPKTCKKVKMIFTHKKSSSAISKFLGRGRRVAIPTCVVSATEPNESSPPLAN